MCSKISLYSWSPQWILVPSEEKARPPMQLLSIKSPKEQDPDIRLRLYSAAFDIAVALSPNSRRLIKAEFCQWLAVTGLWLSPCFTNGKQ